MKTNPSLTPWTVWDWHDFSLGLRISHIPRNGLFTGLHLGFLKVGLQLDWRF